MKPVQTLRLLLFANNTKSNLLDLDPETLRKPKAKQRPILEFLLRTTKSAFVTDPRCLSVEVASDVNAVGVTRLCSSHNLYVHHVCLIGLSAVC